MPGRAPRRVGALVALSVSAACASPAPALKTQLEKQKVELPYELPTYSVTSGPALQSRGAVTALAVAPTYDATVVDRMFCTRLTAPGAGDRAYEIYTVPTVVVAPGSARFRIRVTNGMAHPLSLDGVLLTVRLDGVERQLDPLPGKPASGRRVLPDEEETFTFDAPDASKLRDGATLSIALSGVVTAVDAQGRPKTRSNLAWEYRVSKAPLTRKAVRYREQMEWDPEQAQRVCKQIELPPPPLARKAP